MKINRENYEMYFLDYHEGRLEPGQVAELLIFLEANPGFKEEFETYEDVPVHPDMSVSFSGKASLKRNNIPDTGPINRSNYETYFIAHTEGLLSPEEQKLLNDFLRIHPEFNTDYELYKKLHIKPDLTIKFPSKHKLKRSILSTRRFYYYSLAAAASLALLFSVYMNTDNNQEPKLALSKGQTVKTTTNLTSETHNTVQPSPTNYISVKKSGTIDSPKPNNASTIQALAISETHIAERLPVSEISPILCTGIASRNIVEPKYIFIRQSKNSRKSFANLYDQINLADRMINDPELAPVGSSPKNVFRSGLEKLGSVFTGKEVITDRKIINFWTLADLGISGYNMLADKDLKLLTRSNNKGKVLAYALKGDEFEFERKRNK
jgi:hypothetical protein